MKKKKIIIVIILLVISMFFPKTVFADRGPKPSIDIKIENLETTNYIIDLFVYDENGDNYNSKADYNGGDGLEEKYIKKLHSMNLDGWISESTRWEKYALFAECAGNIYHEHTFSYFGTPTRYKIIIINNETDELKVSEEIIRKEFNSSIKVDYETMSYSNDRKSDNNNEINYIENDSNIWKTLAIGIIDIIITIVIELLIALLLNTGNYKIIVLTNFITNLLLQLLLLLLVNDYKLAFIIGEILVIISELIMYLLTFKKCSKLKIAIYCISANIVTIASTIFIYNF